MTGLTGAQADAASQPADVARMHDEAQRVLASRAFRASPRHRRFLQYLVEQTLLGDGARVKEFAIAVDVLGRPPERFDPRADPIVRVEAARLRERLAAYYRDEAPQSPVELYLPRGRYEPRTRARPRLDDPVSSIAVLPFANFAGDAGIEPFCDGLTDVLIDALVRLPDLKVIARTSTARFRHAPVDVRDIGRKLGVATVLEGSVQQHAGRFRVTAQLVVSSDGAHLWSQSFESRGADVLDVQAELAGRIAASLAPRLRPEVRQGVVERARRGTSDAQARELHDRARFIARSLDVARYDKALALVGAALARDPAFAAAHALAGLLHTNLVVLGAQPAAQGIAAARAALERALALDAELGIAHALLAFVAYSHDFDWDEAQRRFAQALRLAPGDAGVHNAYASFLGYAGRFDACFAHFARARELDPLHIVPRANEAQALWFARRFEDALAACEAVLELDPRQFHALATLPAIHASLGDHDAALAAARHFADAYPGVPAAAVRVAEALALGGRRDEARAVVGAIERDFGAGFDALLRAIVHAALDEADALFAVLDEAGRRRLNPFCAVAAAPTFDRYHADTRWPALLREYRFPRTGVPRTAEARFSPETR